MSQALALQGHSVVLHVRSDKFSSDLLCRITEEYGIHPSFKVKAWKIGNFKGSCYIYGFLSGFYAWFSLSSCAYCRSLPASIVTSLLGIQTIIELHQPLTSTQPAWFISLLRCVWNFSRKVRFIAITEALKNFLESSYPECRMLIKVAPDAADEHPLDVRPFIFLQDDRKINVGYCGHLYSWKGV